MKLFFSNTSASGILATVSDYESAYVAKDVYIGSTDTAAIYGVGANSSVFLYGHIVSYYGIDLGDSDDDVGNVVNVYKGASIYCPEINTFGIRMLGANSHVINAGTIESGYGVIIGSTDTVSVNTITNSGSIISNDSTEAAISRYSGTTDKVVVSNTGIISGATAYLGDNAIGVDAITNKGTIKGNITLGVGADVYNGKSGTISGNVFGGADADSLTGGKESNKFYGDDGADTLYGYLGADKLTGGSGADTFIYKNINESVKGSQDTILDFSHSDGDRINLHAIDANASAKGNQDFNFISSNAFSGHAGELHYRVSSGNTYVEADIDGNKTADMIIKLTGSIALSSGDFLL